MTIPSSGVFEKIVYTYLCKYILMCIYVYIYIYMYTDTRVYV